MEWFEQGDLDRLTDGGWATALAAAMLSIGLVSGLVTWLKGRRLLAVLVWLLLAGVTAALAALSFGVGVPTAFDRTTWDQCRASTPPGSARRSPKSPKP